MLPTTLMRMVDRVSDVSKLCHKGNRVKKSPYRVYTFEGDKQVGDFWKFDAMGNPV
jgi:hypothetical protein